MKTKLFYLSLLVMTQLFAGCISDDTMQEHSTSVAEIDEEIIALISEIGFDTNGILVTNDAYWVEEDIVIPKDYLEMLRAKEPQTRQHYYGEYHLVSRQKLGNIRIAVNPNYADSQKSKPAMNRITDALLNDIFKQFNELPNCAINISKVAYSSNSNNYDILIEDGYYEFNPHSPLHERMICASEIPNGGSPGKHIYINTQPYSQSWDWTHISLTKIKTALTHAIGHCLGLAHTGLYTAPYPTGGFRELDQDPEWIEGTPSGDNTSVMSLTEHNYDNYTTSFSEGDVKAFHILYWKYKFMIDGHTSVKAAEGYDYSYSLERYADSYPFSYNDAIITWSITGGTLLSQTYQWVKVKFYSGAPQYEIGATVKIDNKTCIVEPLKLTMILLGGTIDPPTQTIVSGSKPEPFRGTSNPSGGMEPYSFQWQSRTSDTEWEYVEDGQSKDYQAPTLMTTTYYRRKATFANGQVCYSNTVIVYVTLPPPLSGGTIIPESQTIPSGSVPRTLTNQTSASGGSGSIAYQWQSSYNKVTWTNIVNATELTYRPPALLQTTYFRRKATDTSDAAAYSNTVEIIVDGPLYIAVPAKIMRVGGQYELQIANPNRYNWSVVSYILSETPRASAWFYSHSLYDADTENNDIMYFAPQQEGLFSIVVLDSNGDISASSEQFNIYPRQTGFFSTDY